MKNLLIITGGSRGIGLATIQLFQSHNWEVINLSRTPCPLENVTHISLDLALSHWPQLETDNFKKQLANAKKIALVHNGATLQKDSVTDLPRETLARVLAINVTAPQGLNQIIMPYLKPGAAIIYIGSTLSEIAVPNAASYTISKHALAGLMKTTAQDCVGTGITTTLICPGATDTEMLKTHTGHNEKKLAAMANMSSFKRLVDPSEIAELIYFAVHHPVLNGAVIHGNLGQIMG